MKSVAVLCGVLALVASAGERMSTLGRIVGGCRGLGLWAMRSLRGLGGKMPLSLAVCKPCKCFARHAHTIRRALASPHPCARQQLAANRGYCSGSGEPGLSGLSLLHLPAPASDRPAAFPWGVYRSDCLCHAQLCGTPPPIYNLHLGGPRTAPDDSGPHPTPPPTHPTPACLLPLQPPTAATL